MSEARWKPRVTVAAVIQKDNRFLLVEELIDGQIRYNQPAGHLESGESLIEAVKRETLEETLYTFIPTGLIGIYRFQPDQEKNETYLRFTFSGEIGQKQPGQLDSAIIQLHWMDYDAVVACQLQHRSPMVLQSVTDSLNKKPYSLDLFHSDFL